MKYLCKIKMLDGSRFEFETEDENLNKTITGAYYIIRKDDKRILLNANNIVYISFTERG